MSTQPQTAEREARRRAILQAAVETFAENGFAASRTREIASRAGVAEGTIYLYFDGKDDLLLTAFRYVVTEFCSSVESLLAADLPFPERLTRFIGTQFERIEADPALAMVLLLESRQTSRFYAGAVRDELRTYANAIDSLLHSGVAQGALRTDLDVPLARRILIGALEEIELEWLVGDRSRALVPQAARVAGMLVRGWSDTDRE